jgi:hypothetical protein
MDFRKIFFDGTTKLKKHTFSDLSTKWIEQIETSRCKLGREQLLILPPMSKKNENCLKLPAIPLRSSLFCKSLQHKLIPS